MNIAHQREQHQGAAGRTLSRKLCESKLVGDLAGGRPAVGGVPSSAVMKRSAL